MNQAKFIKHFLFVLCGFLVVFTFLFFWLKGQSGGDIALVMFSVIFLIVYSLIIGFATYSWEFKAKIGLISGLLTSYFLAYILFNFLI